MELRPEQLASQGADTALAPVYLIAGPEPLRVLEAPDAIRARARRRHRRAGSVRRRWP
jgi:DNA polymerase-3 subunit delta